MSFTYHLKFQRSIYETKLNLETHFPKKMIINWKEKSQSLLTIAARQKGYDFSM